MGLLLYLIYLIYCSGCFISWQVLLGSGPGQALLGSGPGSSFAIGAGICAPIDSLHNHTSSQISLREVDYILLLITMPVMARATAKTRATVAMTA